MCFSDASSLRLYVSPCCWCVPRGQALSIYATQTARLLVLSGRAWITVDGPHTCAKKADWILSPGQSVAVLPRQRLVVEAWARFPDEEVLFCWHAPW